MNYFVFWDMTPCGFSKKIRHLGIEPHGVMSKKALSFKRVIIGCEGDNVLVM
jgi:hypothetical protein